jgi:acetyl esterase/lipase
MTDATLNRRALFGAAALAGSLIGARAVAQTAPAPATVAVVPQTPTLVPSPPEPAGILSQEVVELWPVGRVPGSAGVTVKREVLERSSSAAHDRAVTKVSRPMMEVFRPEKPNGAAIIVAPGGGFVRLAIDKEGAGAARRLTREGITCFVLNYRLAGDGWADGYDAALQDVQRAVRLVRSRAATWGLDPKRIGVMGFSAGGHVAAASLTRHDAAVYQPVDAADQVSARPDVVMLGYAAMSVGGRPGNPPTSAETGRALYERAREGLAPTFIMHASDDPTVPVTGSLAMYGALKAAKVPSELHIYQEGGHGFGFSLSPEIPASAWPDAFVAWLRRGKFI